MEDDAHVLAAPERHAVFSEPGQIRAAGELSRLLAGSAIVSSHHRCGRVQDPYSFRCQPQVMGAALDLLTSAGRYGTLTKSIPLATTTPPFGNLDRYAPSGPTLF